MPDTATLYERDGYAWTQDQAARLRTSPEHLRPNGLDVAHLAEEVEDLGRSQRQAVDSLLTQILVHLLTMEFHPAVEARRHWQREINALRSALRKRYRDNPSLQAQRAAMAAIAWQDAWADFRRDLALDAPEALAGFDAAVPADAAPRYAVDAAVLAEGWFPAPAAD
jgi:hypothetical protein